MMDEETERGISLRSEVDKPKAEKEKSEDKKTVLVCGLFEIDDH